MRRVVAVIALGLGCGGSDTTVTDGNGDGDGQIARPDSPGTALHTVKVTLVNRPMNAGNFTFLVAFQDGSSPWQLAPAPTGDTYALPINAPSWGVAYTCIAPGNGTTVTQLRLVTSAHFAIGERTELTLDVPARCSDRAPANVTLSGTVTNRPTTGFLAVQFGTRTAFVGTTTGTFSLETPPGTHDLIVVHANPEGSGEFYVDGAVVQRNVAISGPTSRTIDYSTAAYSRIYPVYASSGARVIATTTLYTANGTQLGMVRESTNWKTEALATSQIATTDVYDQAIAVSTLGQSATITNATTMPGAQTYIAPPALGAVAATVATKMPYVILDSTWPAYTNTIGYTWSASQQLASAQCGGNAGCTIVWTALVSPGVTGATPGYRMPDLSGLAGWKNAFQLASGVQISGGVTATTSTLGASDFPTGIPTSGTKRAFVRTDYAVTP